MVEIEKKAKKGQNGAGLCRGSRLIGNKIFVLDDEP